MNEPQTNISFKNVRNAFYVYCDMIKRHGKGREGASDVGFYIGNVILISITCEIGLKALLVFENKHSHGHYLNELFNELSSQMRKSIIQCTSYELDYFNKALSENKDHFIKWRYYYESHQLVANYGFILKLFYSIKAHLDEIKPELSVPAH